MEIRSKNEMEEEEKEKEEEKEEEERDEELEGAYISSEKSSFHPIQSYQHSVPPRHLL